MPRNPALTTEESALYAIALENGITTAALNTPPVSPSEGDCYIVGTSPTGAWTGKANRLAVYDAAAWAFVPDATAIGAAHKNLIVGHKTTGQTFRWQGAAWRTFAAPTKMLQFDSSLDPHPQYLMRHEAGGGSSGPNAFTFTAQTEAFLNTVIESNSVTLAGDADAVWPLAVRGDGSPQVQVAGGSWAVDGTARTGDSLKVRLTSSGSALTARTATVYAPGRSAVFSVTTADVFAVTSLPDLRLWLDADDPATITDASGKASQWNDKSGGGHHAVRSVDGPDITAAGLNGKTVLTFNAANDIMRCATGAMISRPMTVFVVASTAASTYGRIFHGGYDVDGRLFIGTYTTGDMALFHGTGSWFSPTNNTPQRFITSPSIICAVVTETALNPWHNGEALDPMAGAMSSATGYNLGAYFGGGQQMIGVIAEVIVTGELTTLERQKTEGYLAHKWGLTAGLPSGHPYKTTAP